MSNIIHIPAQFSWPAKAHPSSGRSVSVRGTLLVWLQRIGDRRMLRRELLTQPDSVLKDAGWSRDAARKEAAKPFWRA